MVTLSGGSLVDYWIPNIDITADDVPSATFTSDVLTGNDDYTTTNEEYKFYAAVGSFTAQTTPFAVTNNYQTAPGLTGSPLTTSSQTFIFEYDSQYPSHASFTNVQSTVALLFTQTDCVGELVESEISTVTYHIEDPSGSTDSIAITTSDCRGS